MAYQLKTTGIAANCTICLAIDPDTDAIKDFASAGVTADILVGANVTKGGQTWKSISRRYWVPGAGTADDDFVKFGTTKPSWTFNSGHSRTIVFIGEVGGGSSRYCGKNSGAYFAAVNTGGGSGQPTMLLGAAASGTAGAPATGTKLLHAVALTHGTSSHVYRAAESDGSTTEESATTLSPSGSTFDWDWAYVNRRDDGPTHNQDKTHAILVFNVKLTKTQVDSLFDDWFGTLLEAAGGDTTPPVLTSPTGAQTGSTTANVGATTDEGNGTMWAVVTVSGTVPSVAQIKASQDNTGAAATWGGSQAISTTGAKTLGATGLTASTSYYAHIVHTDAAANDSNRVSSTQFTTDAGGGGGQAVRTIHQTFMRG